MKSFKQYITEATIKQELPHNHNMVDPALLTLDEYYKLSNESDKYHPADAYNWTVDQMNRQSDDPPAVRFPKLINTIQVKGINFEVRARVIDTYTENKYVKYDADNNQVRIDGEIQYYTPEELERMGRTKYSYEFGIVDVDNNKVVGVSQDEWGCVLIAVASEYRGFGLGELISKWTRKYQPAKPSGGFTAAGHRTFIKVHREFVRDYLVHGKYNALIKSGQITPERVTEIVASAKLHTNKKPSKLAFNAPTDFKVDPNQWMLYSENGEFILYDRRLADHWQSDMDSYWLDKFFIGMIYASEGYATNVKILYIHHFGGMNDDVKRNLIMCQLTECKKHGESLRIDDTEILNLLDQSLINVKPATERGQVLVTLKGAGIQYAGMVAAEKKFRESFDRYGEFGTFMIETAYSIFD